MGRGEEREREGRVEEGREKVGEKKKRRKSGDFFSLCPARWDFVCVFLITSPLPSHTTGIPDYLECI